MHNVLSAVCKCTQTHYFPFLADVPLVKGHPWAFARLLLLLLLLLMLTFPPPLDAHKSIIIRL